HAPTICAALSNAGRLKKYELTNTAVAIHPSISVMATSRRNRDGLGLENPYAVRALALPLAEHKSCGLELRANRGSPQSDHLLEHGHQHAAGVVAEHGAARDARELAVLRHGDREAVAVVDVQHHVDVRTTVADVDHAIGGNPQP